MPTPKPASTRLAVLSLAVGLALAGRVTDVRAQSPTEASPASEDAPVVLASAEGFTITSADVLEELAHQPGRLRFVQQNPQALRDVLEKMVERELLAREAARRHYDEHPAVVQAVKEEAVQQLHRTQIDDQITPKSIPAAEVKAFYDAHGDQFHRPSMRRARHILVENLDDAKKLLAQARKADEREFQALARQHSLDTETRQRGGDLRFFALEDDPKRREAPVHPAIRKAAFSFKQVGDTVKKPVAVDGRYSIVRLTGVREARHTTLEQAEPSIRTRLWREARREALKALMKRLSAQYKPQVYKDRVDAIDLSDVDGRPSGFAPDPAPKAPRAAKSGK